MDRTKPIPPYLASRYRGWRATSFADNEVWYKRLALEGQTPQAMVIACCDSRVTVESIFVADAGEFFIHRNIANLVPPYRPESDLAGTSAAIEYAVKILKVAHIIVLGHSRCGGVEACYNSCASGEPAGGGALDFVDAWLDILRPRYAHLPEADEAVRRAAFEHEAILASITNLLTFPFVEEAVAQKRLALHGAWIDIADGTLLTYDGAAHSFGPTGKIAT